MTVGFERKQADEARRRLAILKKKGYKPEVLRMMCGNDDTASQLVISERGMGGIGVLYSHDEYVNMLCTPPTEEILEGVRACGALPYAATSERTEYGNQLTVFAVSKYEEEWARDRRDLEGGAACCYAGVGQGYCEWGMVGYSVAGGGLVRTW